MFSLILALISIFLVGMLALAAVYYGGDSFSRSAREAKTAEMLAEVAQIEAAAQLFLAEKGRKPSNGAELLQGREYLTQMPPNWGTATSFLETSPNAEPFSREACLSFNFKRLGINIIPSCGDPLYLNMPVCCDEPPASITP